MIFQKPNLTSGQTQLQTLLGICIVLLLIDIGIHFMKKANLGPERTIVIRRTNTEPARPISEPNSTTADKFSFVISPNETDAVTNTETKFAPTERGQLYSGKAPNRPLLTSGKQPEILLGQGLVLPDARKQKTAFPPASNNRPSDSIPTGIRLALP